MKKVFLGINVSHGASAALIINGEIVAAYQEERFNKIKNFVGYPKKSIDECIKYIKSKKLFIDEAGFSTINNPIFPYKYPLDNFFTIQDWFDYYSTDFYSKKQKIKRVKKIYKIFNKKNKKIDKYLNFNSVNEKDYFDNPKLFRTMQSEFLKKQSKGLIKKISFVDHHTCHAYYAAFAPDIKESRSAILTIDGEGDRLNQTFWIFDKKKKKLNKINESKQNDLARVYRFITLILKMKPNEHEFKVMGLAPYAKNEYSLKTYKDVFKDILTVKNCKIIHKKRPRDLFNYLYDKTKKHRFDNIAGAVQIFVEEIVTQLVTQIYKKYNLKSFSISGGVSMNIKMNLVLAKLKYVKNIYVAPTGTDESLSIGACYFLNRKNNQKYLKNIYLGQNLSEIKLNKKNILNLLKNKKNISITEKTSHKTIAKILNNGDIVAIARGKEEFGARALGNRSILANPSSNGIVEKINEQIKNRDFWMPFALTILDKFHKKYLKNEKNISSNFMTIAFETINKNYLKIRNGTHFYDKTARPQILQKKLNPEYYSIINEFYKISNIPAVLNTSLNLHGYPVSSTIEDVFFTFLNSDIKYLYLEDNYLIKKN